MIMLDLMIISCYHGLPGYQVFNHVIRDVSVIQHANHSHGQDQVKMHRILTIMCAPYILLELRIW